MLNLIFTVLCGHEAAFQIVYYLNSKGLYGAVIPFLISISIIIYYNKKIKLSKQVVYIFLLCLVFPFFFHVWNYAGLRMVPITVLVWPLYSLFTKKYFPIFLIYPLVYFDVLIPDILLNYVNHLFFLHRLPWYWWTETGGAGFSDGLFLTPLLVTAICLIGFIYFKLYKKEGVVYG